MIEIKLNQIISKYINLLSNISKMNNRIFSQIIQQGQDQIQVYNYNNHTNSQPSLPPYKSPTKQYSMNQSLSTMASPLNPLQSFSFSQRQCRICLETSQQSSKQLLKLCKCIGSVEFIHKQCFKMWLEKSFATKSKEQRVKFIKSKQVQCQMCKEMIKVEFQQQKMYCSFQRFKFNVQNRYFVFAILIAILIVAVTSFILSVLTLSNDGVHLQKKDNKFTQTVLMIGSIIATIILAITSVFFIFQEFLIISNLIISKIYEKLEDNSRIKKINLSNSILNVNNPENHQKNLLIRNQSKISQPYFDQQINIGQSNITSSSIQTLKSENLKRQIHVVKKNIKIMPMNFSNHLRQHQLSMQIQHVNINE